MCSCVNPAFGAEQDDSLELFSPTRVSCLRRQLTVIFSCDRKSDPRIGCLTSATTKFHLNLGVISSMVKISVTLRMSEPLAEMRRLLVLELPGLKRLAGTMLTSTPLSTRKLIVWFPVWMGTVKIEDILSGFILF